MANINQRAFGAPITGSVLTELERRQSGIGEIEFGESVKLPQTLNPHVCPPQPCVLKASSVPIDKDMTLPLGATELTSLCHEFDPHTLVPQVDAIHNSLDYAILKIAAEEVKFGN